MNEGGLAGSTGWSPEQEQGLPYRVIGFAPRHTARPPQGGVPADQP